MSLTLVVSWWGNAYCFHFKSFMCVNKPLYFNSKSNCTSKKHDLLSQCADTTNNYIWGPLCRTSAAQLKHFLVETSVHKSLSSRKHLPTTCSTWPEPWLVGYTHSCRRELCLALQSRWLLRWVINERQCVVGYFRIGCCVLFKDESCIGDFISVFLCKWEVWSTREREATFRIIGSLFSLTVLLSRPVNDYTLWIAAFDQTLACFITVAFNERVCDTCWWFVHHLRTVWGIKTGGKKGNITLVRVITRLYNRQRINQ